MNNIVEKISTLPSTFQPQNGKNKFNSNNDAFNECENERIFLNLREFVVLKKHLMDGWTNGRTDGWMDGWTDGRTDGPTDRRTDGWMDRWTDGRTKPLIEMRGRI